MCVCDSVYVYVCICVCNCEREEVRQGARKRGKEREKERGKIDRENMSASICNTCVTRFTRVCLFACVFE